MPVEEIPKVLYFAYCVNMLARRMQHCIDPQARNLGIVKLPDHELKFGRFSEVWKGRIPTVVPSRDSVVWGTLWEMRECKLGQLDMAQGVGAGVYQRIPIQVFSTRAKAPPIDAVTYKLKKVEDVKIKCGRPMKRYRPSLLYKAELMEAAEELCLPLPYKKLLRDLHHNGYTGSVPPIFDDDDMIEVEDDDMSCAAKARSAKAATGGT